jgi:4-amino-4-deoxy-L-arabinose transferase-like glycosyltransferase
LYCLVRFTRQRQPALLCLSAVLFAAAVYVRPIGYFLPLALALVLVLWAGRQREKKLLAQAFLFGLLSLALIGAWQLRNKLTTGYAGFSSAVDYNLYFHQVAALRAREQQVPFYQVLDEMGFYSHAKYLAQNPEQESWSRAQQYEFMRTEGVKATWREPLTAANIYLHGLMISMFDPGASEYLRLFRLYPQSGRILNGVVSEGIIATAMHLIQTKPLLCALTCGLGLMLLLYYVLSIFGLSASAFQHSLSLWLLLTTGVYLIALSGGTIAASRFRLPAMLVICILAGQGLSIALSRLQVWKEQIASGLLSEKPI